MNCTIEASIIFKIKPGGTIFNPQLKPHYFNNSMHSTSVRFVYQIAEPFKYISVQSQHCNQQPFLHFLHRPRLEESAGTEPSLRDFVWGTLQNDNEQIYETTYRSSGKSNFRGRRSRASNALLACSICQLPRGNEKEIVARNLVAFGLARLEIEICQSRTAHR